MKIKMIEIQATNKSHALEVAMLVDKKEFLQEINRLREKWKISKLTQVINSLGVQFDLNVRSLITNSNESESQESKKLDDFYNDIDGVLRKFRRGKNFKMVVIYALFAGVIPDNLFSSCYFEVATLNEVKDKTHPENDQFVIVLSPRTELKEVKQVFNEFKEHIKNKILFESRKLSEDNREQFLNSTEINEFKKLSEFLDSQYLQHEREIKGLPIKEALLKKAEFFDSIRELTERYKSLKARTPLDINDSEDASDIHGYNAGQIYSSALIDHGNRRDLERTREWYWMRYQDYLNGVSTKPRIYEEVAEMWWNLCPVHKGDVSKKERKICPQCRIDASHISHALSPYEKLLDQ